MISIERVTEVTPVELCTINNLLGQQTPGRCDRVETLDALAESLANPRFHFFAVIDDQMPGTYIGMGTVFFQKNLARWIGEIHDVVMDEQFRGMGVGETLVRKLMATAQHFCAVRDMEMKLYLTSRPSRVRANKLYVKLGFVLVAEATGDWGTNLYKIIVSGNGFRGL